MPKLRFILSVLALCLSNRPVQAQTTGPKLGTATVSGRVVLKGEPAQDVAVVLQPQVSGAPLNPDAVLRVRTDSSGRFHIAAVAAGRFSITAFSPGAVSPGDMNFGGMPGKTLNVSDGENVDNIDLALKPGGVITGHVTNSQGRPLVDERVTLNRIDREGRPQQFYGSPYSFDIYNTDDRGVYRIYGLPEGRYRISVGYSQAPGSIAFIQGRTFYPMTYYPDTTDESQAKVIEVTEGDEATNIDITVGESKRSYDIYGRVVDEGGQPVAGVAISYGSFRDGRLAASGSNGERSRANGEFRLIGVLPGKYGVFARSDGDSDYFSDPVMCDISEGDAYGVEIKVREGSSVSGVVAIEGTSDPKTLSRLSQINLRVFTRPNSAGQGPMGPMRPIRVNADGSFQVRGLQQGKLEISILTQPGVALARIEHNGAPQREGIDVRAGENVTGVKVVLTSASLSLRGELKIVGVVLPQGQRIIAIARRTDQSNQNQPSSSAEIDARGQFVIENLAPGEYEVRAIVTYSPNADRPDPQLMRAFSMATQRVTLSSNNQPPITLIVDLTNK
jgi:protocatechuate 3,4-dioxygenase beta subunit